MRTILALVDGSLYAGSVCDLAAWAAARTASTVTLLHVLGRRETATTPIDLSGSLRADAREALLAELAANDESRARLAQKRGRLLLDDARARIEKAAAATGVEAKLRHGDLLDAVAELEPEAALVVVGKRGEAADFAKGHLGSNLERIVRASTRPVLVAARAFRPIAKVVLAYDASPSAERALDLASHDPMTNGLAVEVITVGDGEAARTRVEAAAERLRAAGRAATGRVVAGEPEEAIGAAVEASEADLLVMGAFGHGRLRALVVGSTTTAMVRRCRIPVLMVR
ncbi:universal stress protein [Salinarimonas ramus]|uniref:Universal stress protein UspA n=1 Tax=Salinarimonas ramus TaxID=690164 RepID=A0A917V5R2_9HYPH|nr:universal stress protein [Salinarimonas ramus]GGK40619.1 universal stress protein UspA [Salinarimonas ramus]